MKNPHDQKPRMDRRRFLTLARPTPAPQPPRAGERPTYIDRGGQAYRICPICAGRMSKTDQVWACGTCGQTSS